MCLRPGFRSCFCLGFLSHFGLVFVDRGLQVCRLLEFGLLKRGELGFAFLLSLLQLRSQCQLLLNQLRRQLLVLHGQAFCLSGGRRDPVGYVFLEVELLGLRRLKPSQP